jgi:two-component system, NtrC family, sensor kinase
MNAEPVMQNLQEKIGIDTTFKNGVVKAYGGKIKAETKEGEGSEFVIQLPII